MDPINQTCTNLIFYFRNGMQSLWSVVDLEHVIVLPVPFTIIG